MSLSKNGLAYCCCIDRIGHKGHIVFNRKSSTDDGLVEFSKVESRINVQALVRQQAFVQWRKVFRRRILETTMLTTEQETTAEKKNTVIIQYTCI